jgi:AAA domain
VFKLVRLGEQGHDGANSALEALREVFLEDVGTDRRGLDKEIERAVDGAIGKALAEPTREDDKGCCRPTQEERDEAFAEYVASQDPYQDHGHPGEDEPEGRNSWAAVDITPVLDGLWKPPQPTVGRRSDGKGLFYPGKCHTAIGETESGKTWLALGAAYEEMKRGNHVLYLDFEDDEGTVVSRLLTIAVSQDDISRRDLLAQRFHYVRPEAPLDDVYIATLRDLITEHRPVLAILDGITEAMTMHGLNPLDNVDAAKFGRMLPRRLAATGAAVVSLDHVTKDRTGRSRYAIGAVHKLNALDGAAYILENRNSFGVGEKGRSVVRIAKDRPGQLRRHALAERNELHNYSDLVLDSTDEGFAELRIFPAISHDDDKALKGLMDSILLLLATKPDGLAQRRILAAIKGAATAKKIEALDELILEGSVTEKSPHKLVNQEEVEPSQTDQTDPVPRPFPSVPGTAQGTRSPFPLLKGNGYRNA